MITTLGKLHIKRYLAGLEPAVAQSIAFGIGNKALSAADTKLQFEVLRTDVELTSLDLVNDLVIYRGIIPEEVAGTIYEAAIYSVATDTAAGQFTSRLISTFDSLSESWVGSDGSASVYVTTGSRIGGDSLRQTPAASGFRSDVLPQLALNLGGYSDADTFSFVYNVGNGNTSSLRFRFFTTNTSYYDFNLGAQTAGYKFVEVNKGSANATGTPSWDSITSIEVTTVSSSSGASQIDLEGIRVEDVDTQNPEYVMVSRELLATPFVKENGQTQEIEFALKINL